MDDIQQKIVVYGCVDEFERAELYHNTISQRS